MELRTAGIELIAVPAFDFPSTVPSIVNRRQIIGKMGAAPLQLSGLLIVSVWTKYRATRGPADR